MTITAPGGSCCSSCGSTRNSRDRCAVRAAEELAPTAVDVLIPHAVLSLMPSVIDRESDVPCEELESLLRVPVTWPNGAKASWRAAARPLLRPTLSLTEAVSATESAVPTVLV